MTRPIDLQGAHWTKTRPQTYTGVGGGDEPRSFDFGVQQLDVLEITDRWTSDYHYFKVRAKGNKFYVLRRSRAADEWEVTQLMHYR